MAIEKPKWATEIDWDDIDSVRQEQEIYGQKVRRRTGDVAIDEQNIRRNGELLKRIRQLDKPLRVPTADDDPTSSFRPLGVVERALHIAEIRRDHARNAARSIDTGPLDRAQLSVHRLALAVKGHPDFVPPVTKKDA